MIKHDLIQISHEAKRFKIIRLRKNLTQKELGKIVGKNQPTILRYENGIYRIPMDIVKVLHEKLNISYEWFFHGKGKMEYTPEKKNLMSDLKTIENNYDMLRNKVESMEKSLRMLASRFAN